MMMEMNGAAKQVRIGSNVIDREYVLSNCKIKVVSGFRNKWNLDDVPHRMHCDLAELCILPVETEGASGKAVMTINQWIVNSIGVGEDELFEVARRNTAGKLVFMNLSEVLNITGVDDETPIHLITNEECLYGGAAIVLPDFLKTVSERIGDFWIIPSSIHEILLVPKSCGVPPRDIKKMVEAVNSEIVSFDEILSDNVYEIDKDGNLKVAV